MDRKHSFPYGEGMKLFVARHGESDRNARHLICGSGNAILTEKGWGQARELARMIQEGKDAYGITHIFVSPLRRARETASCVEEALQVKAVVDSRLHEVYFGEMEECHYPYPEFDYIKGQPFMHFPGGGESMASAAARVYPLIEEVKAMKIDGNVLFVCHGMIMRVIRTYFKDMSNEEFLAQQIGNCTLDCFDL